MEKKFKQFLIKEINSDDKTVAGHVSTFEYDRDGERFAKGSWELENFRKNPVVLWAHDHRTPPIGKAVDLKEDDNGLYARTKFDEKGELAKQVFSLFEGGFLNAFSVGFIRKAFVMEDREGNEKGLAITQAELYEYSAVSVPANPGALVNREVAEVVMKTLGKESIEVVQSKYLGDQYLILPAGCEKNSQPFGKKKKNPDDLEPALHGIIELAKIAKGSPLTETRKGLLTTAQAVFNDILTEANPKGFDGENLKKLKDQVSAFAKTVAELVPEEAENITKTISQLEKTFKGRPE